MREGRRSTRVGAKRQNVEIDRKPDKKELVDTFVGPSLNRYEADSVDKARKGIKRINTKVSITTIPHHSRNLVTLRNIPRLLLVVVVVHG